MDKVYDAALEKYGRRPADYHLGQAAVVYVAPSRTQAWETAARPLHYMTSQYVRWFAEAGDMPGAGGAQAALVDIDQMLRQQSFDFLGQPALIGTPDDVAAMIADLQSRSRITHFCCVTPSTGMDDEAQFERARRLIKRETGRGESAFISQLVLLETEWALRSRYAVAKAAIVAALSALLEARELQFEDESSVEEAVFLWKNSSAKFADCLINAHHRAFGCRATATFDAKALKLSGFIAA